jgi:hypothetical protein
MLAGQPGWPSGWLTGPVAHLSGPPAVSRADDALLDDRRIQPSLSASSASSKNWATSGSSGITTGQRGGRNPASVTLTSRRTAALEGRLLAAPRAWRQ